MVQPRAPPLFALTSLAAPSRKALLLVLTSSSANFGLTFMMFAFAALRYCSEGGMTTAMFMFSVRRMMKKKKREVLSSKSAMWAEEAEMDMCFLCSISFEKTLGTCRCDGETSERGCGRMGTRCGYIRQRLLPHFEYPTHLLTPMISRILLLSQLILETPLHHTRNSQASRPLEKRGLSRSNDLGQRIQHISQCHRIRYQIMNNLRPRLKQTLVPDACSEETQRRDTRKRARPRSDLIDLLFVALVAEGAQVFNQVHLVYADPDSTARRYPLLILRTPASNPVELSQRPTDPLKRIQIPQEPPTLHIKHVHAHRHVRKYLLPLRLQERVHESVLPSAVPEVQGQVVQEAHVGVFDVDGCAQTPHIPRDVVAENYGAHGGFASAGAAHEEEFAVFLLGWHSCGGGLG